MSRSRIAIILSELLSLVRGMLRGNLMDLGLRNGKHAQDMLDNCMKKLATAAKKIKVIKFILIFQLLPIPSPPK